MNSEFMIAINELVKEKGISKEVLIEAIESALVSAYKKNYGTSQNVRVSIDRVTGDVDVLMRRDVVEEVWDEFDKSINKDKQDEEEFSYFEVTRIIEALPRYKELISICYMQDEEEKTIKFNKWCAHDGNIKLLKDAFPIIMTTNISSSKLGTANHKFDLVIMDEAGQSNCATALLPIARAKSLLLVGDTNQLKPVILLEDNVNEQLKYHFNISSDFDYNKNSILELMRRNDPISKDIMLTYHYRCGRKIINFSNKRFYDNKLNLDNLSNEGNISLLDVKNVNSKLRNKKPY